MRERAGLVIVVLVATVLAGCASPTGKVGRDGLDFPVVSSVQGVSNATSGEIGLVGANGIRVAPGPGNSTLTVGLGPVVQTRGIFQACRDDCDAFQTLAGMVIAEGSLISFNNLTLNARGPDGDSVVFFYDDGKQDRQYFRWFDARDRFELSGGIRALGPVEGAGYVGTADPIVLQSGEVALLVTAALEGLAPAVSVRGSAQLTNGTANVSFPPEFVVLLGAGPITAQVTLTSKAAGLWVSEKRADHITVESVRLGDANATAEDLAATFDYFVQAPRRGSEGFQSLRAG